MLYNTGLLIGRAYALAHQANATEDDAVHELHCLAAGDRMALVLAAARVREFAISASGTRQERRAMRFLHLALERTDALENRGRLAPTPIHSSRGSP